MGPLWRRLASSISLVRRQCAREMNTEDVQVISDGRAANEGIRPNDRILAVNGKNTSDLSPADLHRLIKRSTGILRLQVERYE